MERKELLRQFRVIDMMLTMHSALRDRYARLARGLDIVLVATSILLSGFVFADDRVMEMLGLDPARTRMGIGLASLVLVIASVIGLVVDWKGARERHARAAGVLAHLKTESRLIVSGGAEASPEQIRGRWRENSLAVAGLPEVPERHFHRLKARHLRKIALSRLMDAKEGLPVWILRLMLVWRAITGSHVAQEQRSGEGKEE